jgi:hypothetical protein
LKKERAWRRTLLAPEAPVVSFNQAMNSWRVNSSGRVEEPEPEPWVAEGAAGAAAEVEEGAGVASAAAEVAAGAEVAAAEVAGAAAEVAAADVAEGLAEVAGVEPEPEAPSQTLGPGMV